MNSNTSNDHSIEIALPMGRLRGRRVEADEGVSGEAVHFFGNIPYAQPPFGGNRFEAPQPPLPWAGVRDSTCFGPAAPQAPRVPDTEETIVGGEDCLTLNIWMPARAALATTPLPVFIYVPGGGFMRGQSGDPMYDGASFARQGVVFVSFNYRIGMDGFMAIDDAAAGEVALNRGLLDQCAAIEWVRQHIALFGGHPARLTLGGVSAGAGAIVHLLGMPALRHAISRVILQSPSITCHSLEDAQRSRTAIASILGTAATRDALAALPLHRVVRVVARLLAEYDLRASHAMSPKHFFPLRPVADGAMVHADPLAHLERLWREGTGTPPQILVGANAQEMNFYLVPGGEIDRVDWPRVRAFAQAVGLDAAAIPETGHPGEVLAALQGAHYYQKPAQALAALARRVGASAWHYQFAWQSPQFGGRMGAAHAMEVPFAFNRLGIERALEMTGANAPQRLADEMHHAWAAFARGESPPRWSPSETKVFS